MLGLVAVGSAAGPLVEVLGPWLDREMGARSWVAAPRLDPAFAFRPERAQYHATEILARLEALRTPALWRVLGVAAVDLYIPILTFVFGEAQLGGVCALVSSFRLRPEFYGLPPDPPLVHERLRKEALHELGHTLALTHCDDYACAMASAHAVESIDLKEAALCPACRARIA
jgi:archaemetzincin